MEKEGSYTTYYFVRHAEAYSGKTNAIFLKQKKPLTKHGEIQTRSFAKEINHIPFAAIFSSNINRAKRTAEIISKVKRTPFTLSELLREKSWGELECQEEQLRHSLLHSYEQMSYTERLHIKLFESMESDYEMLLRLYTFLQKTAKVYKNKTILAITHSHFMGAFLVHLGLGTHAQFVKDSIENLGYFKLLYNAQSLLIEETKGIHVPVRMMKVSSVSKQTAVFAQVDKKELF